MSTATTEERPEEKIIKTRIILWSTALLALILPILSMRPIFVMFIAVICYLALVLFLDAKVGFLTLLIVRPLLDHFSADTVFSVGVFRLNFASILALIIIITAGALMLLNRQKTRRLPLAIWWIFFLVSTLAGVAVSFDAAASLAEWLRLLSIFSLFVAGFILTDSLSELRRLVKIIVLSALLPALFAVYQYLTATGLTIPLEGIYNRIYGTFAHPNLFAYFLIVSIALAAYLVGTDRKKLVADQIFALPLVFFLLILVLTYTRGAWLALVLVLLIIGLIRYRKTLVLGLAIILLAYLFVTPISNRVNDLFSMNPYGSVVWRIRLWTDSLGLVKDKRLLGYGTGTARELILDARGEASGSADPHNDYLKIALENGAIGLISYSALLMALICRLLISYISAREEKLKILSLFIFGLLLSFIIMGFADNILRNTALQWALWSASGALFAVSISAHETTVVNDDTYTQRRV